MADQALLRCVRCGGSVATPDYEVYERMHRLCFHFDCEHGDLDVDEECGAGGCPSRRLELRSSLQEWTDWDVAAFRLGRALGVFTVAAEQARSKSVFWSDDPVGNALHDTLLGLVAAGVLERREEPDEQFRWAG